MSVVSASCYELLGVPVQASRADLARAWSEQREQVRKDRSQYSDEEVEALCARIDEAFSILADPDRSARYRAYLAQRDGETTPVRPEDLLHPALASSPQDELPIPASPPPWLGDRPVRTPPVGELVDDALAAIAGPPTWESPETS